MGEATIKLTGDDGRGERLVTCQHDVKKEENLTRKERRKRARIARKKRRQPKC